MPAQPRHVRLRIPSFTSPPNSDSSDDGKDIIFELLVDTLKREISDSVIAFPLAFWHGGVAVPLNIIKYMITIAGVVTENDHTAHAVTTATAHSPDFIDMEEAIISWSGNAPKQLVHLEVGPPNTGPSLAVPSFTGVNDWRTYQGVILKASLTRNAGHLAIEYELIFGVLFDPTSLPGLREWA